LEIGNLNDHRLDIGCGDRAGAAHAGNCMAAPAKIDSTLIYRNATTAEIRRLRPLAPGLGIEMMEALSCGATGVRPQAIP
jgi:hypothetical protein